MGACRVASFLVASYLALSFSALAGAEEPNDTFGEATVLNPGVLTVSDDLYPGEGGVPDTLLGAFDSFGSLVAEDDDGSTLGDGVASGFSGVPVNIGGDIRFSVTGFGDDFYEGFHDELGGYEAFVEVFDFFGDSVDEFSVTGTLAPGTADDYFFSDFNWLSGSYSVNIDNTVGGAVGGDVDFFTFTGLAPGAMFSAETLAVGSIDTMLGWYDALGNQLDFNDDFNEINFLSQLQGTVPTNGQLTFAVTGYGDDFFEGAHTEQEFYDLQLTIDGADLPGDFDGDSDVDADDLVHPTLGWQARYGNDLHGADYLTWQQQYDSGAGIAAASVPEPSVALLLYAAILPLACRRAASY